MLMLKWKTLDPPAFGALLFSLKTNKLKKKFYELSNFRVEQFLFKSCSSIVINDEI